MNNMITLKITEERYKEIMALESELDKVNEEFLRLRKAKLVFSVCHIMMIDGGTNYTYYENISSAIDALIMDTPIRQIRKIKRRLNK